MSDDAYTVGSDRYPKIVSVTKLGPHYANPEWRISFEKCSFCEQTSLDGRQSIKHARDCPHVGGGPS